MRERLIEQYLKKRIHILGGLCVKMVAPGWNGWPDRIVILEKGHVDWVELKQRKGLVAAHQVAVHRLLRKMGQNVLIIRSIEEVDFHYPAKG